MLADPCDLLAAPVDAGGSTLGVQGRSVLDNTHANAGILAGRSN